VNGGNEHARAQARPTPEQVTDALRRAWFPVARSVDLDRPQGVTLLGEPIVAFRTASGRTCVTSRRCPHRGGDLALGTVVDDAIECPYHGWRYDGETGRCSYVPSLAPDGRIPPGAVVDAHPVVERFGLVWTCIGDPVVDAPDLPELEPMGMSYLAGEPVDTPAGILASLENFRDVAHFPFVHRASMGDVPHEVEKLDVTTDGFDTWLRRSYSASDGAADVYRDQEGIGFTYHSVVPSLSSALIDYGPVGKRIVMEAFMPVGPTGCRIFLVSGTAANWTGAPPEEALAAELGVLHEDKPILDSLIPLEVPLNREAPEVSVAADRYTLATRRAFVSFVRQAMADPVAEPAVV
jgi:phenylpropionate dioxygenase-like ring-hydroxylating dioxygenase large terminal subunit